MTETMSTYQYHETGGAPIKAWTRGVPVEDAAMAQLRNVARLPFIHKHVAAMPDVHWGIGATVGSVIPAKGAIIPAAVGVDIGCGMCATRSSLTSHDLPDSLSELRREVERKIPLGFGVNQKLTGPARAAWEAEFAAGYAWLEERYPKVVGKRHPSYMLGSLGGGNHFLEVCLDEADRVWVMLHSGSRGIGNAIGRLFIELAKQDMRRYFVNLPDKNLAYLPEGTEHFDDYVEALTWAQRFAFVNRQIMMDRTLAVLRSLFKGFETEKGAVNCHHNYAVKERHFGEDVWVTRKGAVRAGAGELGIIPGSMGAKSFIVRGRGNPDSFMTCSHGAGRAMSRSEAKKRFTVEDHVAATEGVECRKDAGVIDETPMAYKDIDAVMAAQDDLVEIVHTLKQVLCVKG
jgi:tRNA-splicing ligase RtcB